MAKKRNTQRSDGRYMVKVYLGITDGKKQYKYAYGKTQKEAAQKAAEIKISMRKGVDVSASGDTFDVWTNYWLVSKKHEVSSEQHDLLRSRAKIWSESLKGIPLNQIKFFQLQAILFEIVEKNPYTGNSMTQKTAKEYIQIVKAIFEFAIDNRITEFNPARKLKVPQNARDGKTRRALTETERRWVMEFEHRAKPSAMLMMLSGLRRGEATALQWSDIDFEKNTISVTKSYNFKMKAMKPPKNGKSRIVSVPQILIDYLKTLPHDSVFVLTTRRGTMMTEDAWKRLYQSYMSDLNLHYGLHDEISKYAPEQKPMVITPFTPHELRHTFFTLLFDAGVDVLTAQEQMGHSDPKITMDIYTHLSQKHMDRQIDKLNLFLQNGSQWGVSNCE